jgi:hypothetical protein
MLSKVYRNVRRSLVAFFRTSRNMKTGRRGERKRLRSFGKTWVGFNDKNLYTN